MLRQPSQLLWLLPTTSLNHFLRQVLLRKGGIDEKGFDIQARELVLFPSYFHADPSLLKPGMAERYQQVWREFEQGCAWNCTLCNVQRRCL